jgi:hypothetical protein
MTEDNDLDSWRNPPAKLEFQASDYLENIRSISIAVEAVGAHPGNFPICQTAPKCLSSMQFDFDQDETQEIFDWINEN